MAQLPLQFGLSPSLDFLPEEVTCKIAVHLDSDDLFALRLACRALDAKTFHQFRTRFFAKKCFMLTTPSLKVFTGIANNARLRVSLKSVYFIIAQFSTDILTHNIPTGLCSTACHCGFHPTDKQRQAYKACMIDQADLEDRQEDRRLITAAFKKLKNLSTVLLVDSLRQIHGIDVAGRFKILRTTGVSPSFGPIDREDDAFELCKSHVWDTILRSIVSSGIKSLETFGTDFVDSAAGLSPTKDLNRSQKFRKELAVRFKNIKTLQLTVTGPTFDLLGTIALQKNFAATTSVSMAKFAALFPKTEKVVLAFNSCHMRAQYLGINHWVQGRKISVLDLSGLSISANKFKRALGALNTLKDFRIMSSDVHSGTWVPILQVLRKAKLSHLHLMFLSQGEARSYFLTQDDDEPLSGPDTSNDDISFDNVENEMQTENAAGKAGPDDDDDMPGLVDQDLIDDFKSPCLRDLPERGYYICLTDEDRIARYLPKFIEEYNVASDYMEGADSDMASSNDDSDDDSSE